MLRQLVGIINFSSSAIRLHVWIIYGVLLGFNAVAWGWALVVFHDFPVLLGTAFMAYGFGLRHALDADHIAAIDNVTRKLMQENKRPVAVGFFFSLGHSSVVVLATLAIAFTTIQLQGQFSQFKEVGGVIGTLVSASFLFVIAMMNFVVLLSIVRAWRAVQQSGVYVDEDFDLVLAGRGFFSRLLRPMFNMIRESWHMFPLGFLFGLGFDTATEIGLLAMSASHVAQGMSPWTMLVFPALFTAGMSLVDTLDGHLMLGAYGWAYIKPVRKMYYNITITLVSVLVALLVGGIEAMGLLAEKFKLQGVIWDAVGAVNDHFGTLGYLIIGIFVLSWLVSVVIYRLRRFDDIDINPAAR